MIKHGAEYNRGVFFVVIVVVMHFTVSGDLCTLCSVSLSRIGIPRAGAVILIATSPLMGSNNMYC